MRFKTAGEIYQSVGFNILGYGRFLPIVWPVENLVFTWGKSILGHYETQVLGNEVLNPETSGIAWMPVILSQIFHTPII